MNIHVTSFDNLAVLPKEELNAIFERIDSATDRIVDILGAKKEGPEYSAKSDEECSIKGFSKYRLQESLAGRDRDPWADKGIKKINHNTYRRSASFEAGHARIKKLEIVSDGISDFLYIPVEGEIADAEEAQKITDHAQKVMFSTFNEIALYRALAQTAERALHDHAIFPNHPDNAVVKELREGVETLAGLAMRKMEDILGEKFSQEAPHWKHYLEKAEAVYVNALESSRFKPSTKTRLVDGYAARMSQSSAKAER